MATGCFFPRGGGGHRPQSKQAAEALEKLHPGGRVVSREEVNGAVRVKIVVSKRELKQMVAALGGGGGGGGESHGQHRQSPPASAEQRLQALRRRRMRRAEAERQQHGADWKPGLQSIPEEVY